MPDSRIAVIPARGGSKRIPRKNLKDFLGKPIVAYSIETALKSGLFDEVMVSTDDEEIAEIAEKHGAAVPFYRTKSNSDDHATTADVLLEVFEQYHKILHKTFEYGCCIYPTAPLVTVDTLKEGLNILKEKKFTSVFPVCAFSYPIYRGLTISSGRIEMLWPENINMRSQDLKTVYHDAGQFYWMQIESFINERKIFTSNTGALILNDLQVQDIDNETDWKLAELKYSLR